LIIRKLSSLISLQRYKLSACYLFDNTPSQYLWIYHSSSPKCVMHTDIVLRLTLVIVIKSQKMMKISH